MPNPLNCSIIHLTNDESFILSPKKKGSKIKPPCSERSLDHYTCVKRVCHWRGRIGLVHANTEEKKKTDRSKRSWQKKSFQGVVVLFRIAKVLNKHEFPTSGGPEIPVWPWTLRGVKVFTLACGIVGAGFMVERDVYVCVSHKLPGQRWQPRDATNLG